MFSPNNVSMPESERLWAVIALEDLASAAVLIRAGQMRNSILLCASALEKAVKLYLFAQGSLDAGDRSHNIAALAKKAGLYDRAPGNVRETFVKLSQAHIPCAYPEAEWQYRAISEKGYAQMVYNSTRNAVEWVFGEVGYVRNGGDGSGKSPR